jgi:general L-amino acid transport system substrate-binding protein
MKLEAAFATDAETTKAYAPAAATPTPPTPRASIPERLVMSNPDDHIVLPESSRGAARSSVRKDDIQWFQIVQWTHYALITAEELGVRNRRSSNPTIRGSACSASRAVSAKVGLTNDWAYPHQARRQLWRIVRAQRRHGLADQDQQRGLNALWNKGACNTPRR